MSSFTTVVFYYCCLLLLLIFVVVFWCMFLSHNLLLLLTVLNTSSSCDTWCVSCSRSKSDCPYYFFEWVRSLSDQRSRSVLMCWRYKNKGTTHQSRVSCGLWPRWCVLDMNSWWVTTTTVVFKLTPIFLGVNGLVCHNLVWKQSIKMDSYFKTKTTVNQRMGITSVALSQFLKISWT